MDPGAAQGDQLVASSASPWPEMRHDGRNTGSSSDPANYQGDAPWSFVSDRGSFSTPVLGGDGSVYIGSADGAFYALSPDGTVAWSHQTEGIIDSAALVEPGAVTVGSGDGRLYRFRTDVPLPEGVDRLLWTFEALPPGAPGQEVSWWEGNVVAGPDGLLLAGNTEGHAYAVRSDGSMAWIHATGNAVWTAAAVDEDGTSYWGSLDFCVHAIDAAGAIKWTAPTLGFVTSSPALALDGTLYVGSFDGMLYALDAQSGTVRWSIPTGDSIYSSPALLEVDGETVSIIIASTDGRVCAVSTEGLVQWTYDTGAVVRSSPVMSRGPSGSPGWITYVGASNGVLYALDAESGARRWSYDTTMRHPVLSDRSSLNGSPALGPRGVHIGSEDGSVWFVPYDYPLHSSDPRGSATMPPGSGRAPS